MAHDGVLDLDAKTTITHQEKTACELAKLIQHLNFVQSTRDNWV